ncbi:MAG: response regulator [Opitutales bacterium]
MVAGNPDLDSSRLAHDSEPKDAGRILLVDDSPLNLKVARLILSNVGAPIDVATDGYEALAMIEQVYHPLIFMDIHMPGIDGIETTRQIRAREFARGQPTVIAISADTRPANRERCLREGLDDFLEKPVKATLLRERALQALKSRTAHGF